MKFLCFLLVLILSLSSFGKVRSVWLKSDNQINTYDYKRMMTDNFLASWYGSNKYTPGGYDPSVSWQTETFFKAIYHWTYNGSRGQSGETTRFTRDFQWNWTHAQRFGLYVHDGYQLSHEGLAQDATFTSNACHDPIKQANILHTGTCAYFSAYAQGLWEGFGFPARRWNVGGGYHSVPEVYYNDAWHHYDLNQAGYILDPTWDHVMSLEEWSQNVSWIEQNCPGNIGYNNKSGDGTPATPKYFEDADNLQDANTWDNRLAGWWSSSATSDYYAFHDSYEHFHDMSFSLRQGEYIRLNWYREEYDEWFQDNLYSTITETAMNKYQSDGQIVYEPVLSNSYNDYYDGLYEDDKIELVSDGIQATGDGAYAIWAVRSAYQISSCSLYTTSTGSVTKEISKDIGETWETISGTNVGDVREMYDFLIRISIPEGSKLTSLKTVTIVTLNPAALPRLCAAPSGSAATSDWTETSQTVRLYTYQDDESISKVANTSDWGASTSLNAPYGGTIKSLTATYNYNVPNPAGGIPATTDINGSTLPSMYPVYIYMGGGGAMDAVKRSEPLNQQGGWVYDYIDNPFANISKMRYELPSGASSAAVRIDLITDSTFNNSFLNRGKVKMHYDIVHSSYSGSEDLTVTYCAAPVTSVTGNDSDPMPTIGAKDTMVATTSGSQQVDANGDSYWELNFDMSGMGSTTYGHANLWVKIENPGQKPFASRVTSSPSEAIASIPNDNPVQSGLRGASGTDIDTYCPEMDSAEVWNLRMIHHLNWDQSWNKGRVAVLGNSITNQNSYWEPLAGNISGISNSSDLNSFKDSIFNQNSWTSGSNCKGEAHSNVGGWTIQQVNNSVDNMLANDRPMIAVMMIGTNNIQQNHSSNSVCYENNDGTVLDCYPDTFEVNQIVEKLKDAGVMPIITTVPPINFDDNSWIRENRQEKLDSFNLALRTYADNNSIPVIDIYNWGAAHGPASALLTDWAHPKSCSDGNASFSDNCLDGGTSGGLQNARMYMAMMYINDIQRFVIEGQGFPSDDVKAFDAKNVQKDIVLENVPNPFNPTTRINYSIPSSIFDESASIAIYNLKGRLIRDFKISSEKGNMIWDGADASGKKVASGMYMCRLKSGSYTLIRKMMLTK